MTIKIGEALSVQGKTGTGLELSTRGRVVLTQEELTKFTAIEKAVLPPKSDSEDTGLVSR